MEKGQRVEVISGQWKGKTGVVASNSTRSNIQVLLDGGDGINPKGIQARVLRAI